MLKSFCVVMKWKQLFGNVSKADVLSRAPIMGWIRGGCDTALDVLHKNMLLVESRS